jgi:hypothetical protein
MIRCNANLFRIASTCQSKEETRYYLCGVYVEPHAVKGVTLVTTDGHRLLCLYDETGHADESAIIALTPNALKECKPGKHQQRFLTIDGANATINAGVVTKGGEIELGDAIAVSVKCRIDGTFPDWRRVVPQVPMILPADESAPSFSGDYLGSMGDIAIALEKHFDRYSNNPSNGRGIMSTVAKECLGPSLVLFPKVQEAFGVLMSVRANAAGVVHNQVPEWLNVLPVVETAPLADLPPLPPAPVPA